ncbi:efflux RND transporter permease subunit [Exilibacterium tricleocarpae]|uniref:Efflux RND transporter permease subunit n=1 Tax=Exilibacterium tricleocarpae TaxID=2591008 RepID=A0A545U996_9GAMM|nr:efflux RND transporter permease subunit [Exilibacterium tricleocarpae]TQV86042.1 efflux RND transporter permease subunit [Exilibacterium tricleocarpae]
MRIAAAALNHNRFTLFCVLAVVLGGLLVLRSYPSQEEPTIPVKQAVVYAENHSLALLETENLIAQPLEAIVEQLPEIANIYTTVRAGTAQLRVELADNHPDTDAAWARLRTRLADAELPDGSVGPFVDDDFGRVAVATYAIVPGEGYNWGDTRLAVREVVDDLNTLEDVGRITVTGLQPERIVITLSREAIAALGLSVAQIADLVNADTATGPAGFLPAGGQRIEIEADGRLQDLDDLRNLRLPLAGAGAVALRDIAGVRRETVEPLDTAVRLDGQPAVVIGVEMQPGTNVQLFGDRLRDRMRNLAAQLPVGFDLAEVSFQADVVTDVIDGMQRTLYLTVAVVLIVTIVFLGWRTGLVVGLSIPITMLGALLLMRPLGLDLNQVTIASFIIALGILVDNATVIAEDISRRVSGGEAGNQAAAAASRTLGTPLLISTLATALAFAPPIFADSLSAQYMLGLAFVMAIVLLISWVVAVAVTPLLIQILITRRHTPEDAGPGKVASTRPEPWFLRGYRRTLKLILRVRIPFAGAMIGVLIGALIAAGNIPFSFLPPSDRDQFQIPFEIAPGAPPEATLQAVQALSAFLNDRDYNPDIVNHVAYIGAGGPRFILGLNPPTAAPHRAFFVVNTGDGADIDSIITRVRHHIETTMPEVEAWPKRFSLGETDAGTAVLRISGRDADTLRAHGEALHEAMTQIPGTLEVHHDWETVIPRLRADVDEARLLASGLTHDQISRTLEGAVRGAPITVYREHGAQLPVVLRTPEHERSNIEALGSLNISARDGQSIPLATVADFALVGELSVIHRRNHKRTITVSGRHPDITAQELVNRLQLSIDNLLLEDGYTLELGGEIEESAESSAAITEYLPHCLIAILGLFLLQFNSVRRTAIIAASVPFCLVGVSMALLLTGMPFDFMSFLGIFALVGTIVSNAILVIERVDQLRTDGVAPYRALVDGATQRLRPIVLTQLTTIFGLIPLMLAAEPLWRSFNVVVVGGLIAGTLISLGLVPVLYALLFRIEPPAADTDPTVTTRLRAV